MTTAVSIDRAAGPPSATAGMNVLQVEDIVRALLLLLDFDAVDALLTAMHKDKSLHCYFHDATLWQELLLLHFAGEYPAEVRFLALPQKQRAWEWTSRDASCQELRDYLRAGDDRHLFVESVRVVHGDIGRERGINDVPFDGLAFPTNSHLTNHYVGAAQAVFTRAGRELTDYVNDPLFRGRRSTGSAVATPAFNAGVEKLIHCVGPSIAMENCFQLLELTYKNTMSTILNEDLHCVALASISTGNMGVPCREGAQVGLRAIQSFLRSNSWRGTIAIVCYEDRVYRAFKTAKKEIVKDFNAALEYPAQPARRVWGF